MRASLVPSAVVVVLVLVAGAFAAFADTIQRVDPAVQTSLSALYADPDRVAGTVGTTPAASIADLAPAAESNVQRLRVCNGSTSARLCVGWIAAGGACASSGMTCNGSDTDGDWVFASSCATFKVAGDLSTCVAATAASTAWQVGRVVHR